MDDLPQRVADLLRTRGGIFRRSKAIQLPREKLIQLCRLVLDPRKTGAVIRLWLNGQGIVLGKTATFQAMASIRKEARELIKISQ